MTERVFDVLFLCTANSARSLLAESLLRHWGSPRFRAWSAGSHPGAGPHPMAIELLGRLGLPTSGLRSKSWEEFCGEDAPALDFVLTVCDRAREEVCPVWPGQPLTAHWGVADPAAVEGDEFARRTAFRTALRELENRIRIFINLPLESLDSLALERELARIGRLPAPSADL